MVLHLDADQDNADWPKRTWDLGIDTVEELRAFLDSIGLSAEAFRPGRSIGGTSTNPAWSGCATSKSLFCHLGIETRKIQPLWAENPSGKHTARHLTSTGLAASRQSEPVPT